MANIDRKSEREKRRAILHQIVGDDLDYDALAALDNAEVVREAARYMRQMREHAGLSQTQLGSRLGVSQPRISELERGDSPEGMSYALLRRTARACGFLNWPLAPLELSSAVATQPAKPPKIAEKDDKQAWTIDPIVPVPVRATSIKPLNVALARLKLGQYAKSIIEMGPDVATADFTIRQETSSAASFSAKYHTPGHVTFDFDLLGTMDANIDCTIMVVAPDAEAASAKGADQIKIICDALNSAPGIKVVMAK